MRLTARDDALLRYLAEVGQAPVDVVAQRFFASDPKTGKANRDPLHAAERRIVKLRDEGFVSRVVMSRSARGEPAGGVVMLDRAGSSLIGIKPKAVHAKHRHHHFQTLRLVEEVRADLERQGRQVLRVVLEDELRAEILSKRAKTSLARAMKRGDQVNLNDSHFAMPDAVVIVADEHGNEAMVAVEYLSSTYREDDLKAKRDLLSSSTWAGKIVRADSARTAKRARAVGLQCEVLE